MRKKILYIGVLMIALMSLLTSSCIKNESCLPASNLLKTEIYTLTDVGDTIKYKINSFSLHVIGRKDSIYANAKEIDEFYIPMADSTTDLNVVINMNGGMDTLWLHYKPFEVFRSTSCGVINRYEIRNSTYTKNSIWQIFTINNLIDENKNTNFYLFYRSN